MSCYQRNVCWVIFEELSTKSTTPGCSTLIITPALFIEYGCICLSIGSCPNAQTKPEIAEQPVLTLTNQKPTEPDQDNRTDSCHNDTTQETGISLDTQ